MLKHKNKNKNTNFTLEALGKKVNTVFRDVFRSQSNIYDRTFLQN